MEPCHHQGLKRHARLRHQPGTSTLWVGDPDDWALVRQQPRPPLVCPEPGCDVELISYENPNNQYNPRIFKFKSAHGSCNHWEPVGIGGGPPSLEHEWLKLYLARTVKRLGYSPTPEHVPTRADVFVEESGYCLEVQLRSTTFRKRTAARKAKGAQVCWPIREGLDSDVVRQALFGLPSVRFRVVDEDQPSRRLAPWDDPDIEHRACVQVFGTVASLEDQAFTTKTIDAETFLTEVLSGQRRWYRPNMLGRKSGSWALKSEVSKYFAGRTMRNRARK